MYEPDASEDTVVVVFGNGTLFVDTGASTGVREIVTEITAELVDIGLLSDPDPSAGFSLAPAEVPVPPEYEEMVTETVAERHPGVQTDRCLRTL